MKSLDKYKKELLPLLPARELKILQKLSTPKKIQDYLDSFPINYPGRGEKIHNPLRTMHLQKMHCIEGAVLASLALLMQGRAPLLLDLQSHDDDDDHVVALFKENNLWGAVSKTNYPVLRYRDPVYRSVRELAMSYFHEYFLASGKKTMLAYSKPFDLRRYKPAEWVTKKDLDWLAEELDDSPHFPVAPKGILKNLRLVSKIETKTMGNTEWSRKGKRNQL
jgi:hypothetical protein